MSTYLLLVTVLLRQHECSKNNSSLKRTSQGTVVLHDDYAIEYTENSHPEALNKKAEHSKMLQNIDRFLMSVDIHQTTEIP